MATQNIFGLVDTWNDGGTTFTAIQMNVTNTASAAASKLLDLQVGGTSLMSVGKGGNTISVSLGAQRVGSPEILSANLTNPAIVNTQFMETYGQFYDTAGNLTIGVGISAFVDDPTDGSEDAHFRFQTRVAGSYAARFRLGAGFYASGQTDPGAGNITANAFVFPGGATLLSTSAALTNGAGASAGTLANAPAAGNPTKWIAINDNGTTRYIPAW